MEEATFILLRWLHFLFGIAWIGLLYYFNLVQTPFFGETDPAVRSGAIQKLVPRALWWFRWGAMPYSRVSARLSLSRYARTWSRFDCRGAFPRKSSTWKAGSSRGGLRRRLSSMSLRS